MTKGILFGKGHAPPRKSNRELSELSVQVRDLTPGQWVTVDTEVWPEKEVRSTTHSSTAWARRNELGVKYATYRDVGGSLVIAATEDDRPPPKRKVTRVRPHQGD